MVIHSRRKTERKPVIKVENNLPPAAIKETVSPKGKTYSIITAEEEKINNKPRNKKKRVVEE